MPTTLTLFNHFNAVDNSLAVHRFGPAAGSTVGRQCSLIHAPILSVLARRRFSYSACLLACREARHIPQTVSSFQHSTISSFSEEANTVKASWKFDRLWSSRKTWQLHSNQKQGQFRRTPRMIDLYMILAQYFSWNFEQTKWCRGYW